jgi:transcriptional regulator GlxA family with amidase domain
VEKSNGFHLAVIGRNVPHSINCKDQVRKLALLVEPSYVAPFVREIGSSITFADAARIGSMDGTILTLSEEFRPQCAGEISESPEYDAYSAGVLGRRIIKALFGSETPPDLSAGLPIEALERVTRYIYEHITEPYAPVAFAEAAGFKLKPFIRLFVMRMKMRPSVYQRYCQAYYAEKLVRTTLKTMIQIAQESGFKEDSSLMAFWIRRIFGKAPTEIRKEVKSIENQDSR